MTRRTMFGLLAGVAGAGTVAAQDLDEGSNGGVCTTQFPFWLSGPCEGEPGREIGLFYGQSGYVTWRYMRDDEGRG